jgi:hypothetical protein
MDKIREFRGVSNEKYGGVISYHIIVALFSVKFNSKSTWVAFCVCRSFFASDCGNTLENGCSLAHSI